MANPRSHFPPAEAALHRDPSLEDIHAIAAAALEALPAPFRARTEGVVIRIAEWPEEEVLEDLGLSSPYDLLGLYQGTALTERSFSDLAPPVDMIFLYRQPLLAHRDESGFDLADIVRNTLIHEIGHHFGLSDEAMEALEAAAEAEDEAQDDGNCERHGRVTR